MSSGEQSKEINEVQARHFELLRKTRYNLLDGERVVNDLLEWRDLWYSVFATRLPLPTDEKIVLNAELALMRATRWDQWPVDTLLIWCSDEKIEQLRKLVEERWEASEVEVLLPDEEDMKFANLFDEDNRVLFVWWD